MSIKRSANGPVSANTHDKTNFRINVAKGCWTPGDFPGSPSKAPKEDHVNLKNRRK